MLLPPITLLGKHQAGQHLMSNRSAFYVEYVSIPLCRSAFGYRSFHCAGQHSSASMLLPPITLLGKHQAGQHLTSNRSAFHTPLRQRFAVQMQRSIPSLSHPPPFSLSLINNYIHAYMCLTVGRQSRDDRPLSRDPSVTFYKKFPNCLKRRKTLFDNRLTVAWPPTTVAWPFSDFFPKIF